MNAVIAADFQQPEAGELQEIRPGLLWLRMPLPFALDHINLYLIREEQGWAVVDCGLYNPETVDIWSRLVAECLDGMPLTRVIVTHSHVDHIGSAGWLCQTFDLPLFISAPEFSHIRAFMQGDYDPEVLETFYLRLGMEPELIGGLLKMFSGMRNLISDLPHTCQTLENEAVLQIGGQPWQVIHSRGHTICHASLYNPQEKILISGDQVLPRISSNVSVGHLAPDANPLQCWLDALQQLKQLPADTLTLPAHNFPFLGLHKRLDELIQGHEDDLIKIAGLCQEPLTVMALAEKVYQRELGLLDKLLACGETLAHLNYLQAEGRVRQIAEADQPYLFSAV